MSIVKGALLSDISEVYRGEINGSELDTTFESGTYKVNSENIARVDDFLIVATEYTNTSKTDIKTCTQLYIRAADITITRYYMEGAWTTWEISAYLSDLTPILSDITKLRTNHTTVSTPTEGQLAWNTTTKKPVWYNGIAWIYADGTAV